MTIASTVSKNNNYETENVYKDIVCNFVFFYKICVPELHFQKYTLENGAFNQAHWF